MNKLLSIVFFVAGVILVIYGINAAHSVGSGFARLFTGAPTEKSIWLLLGGFILAAIGAGGLLRGTKSV